MQKCCCGRVGNSLELESKDRLLGALEGADHVDLVERSVGDEVDDKRKDKGKHYGEHITQRLDSTSK